MIAVAFIVLAIIAGSGSKKGGGGAAPTPSTTARSTPAPTAAESTEPEAESEGSSEGEGRKANPSEAAGAGAEELGYPSFATSNTTRIGGSDPVSNAAATALAVFPSTNEKQRPVAVALVGAEDWAGAIAAGVLMAEPIRAPLLFGEAEGVPDATARGARSAAAAAAARPPAAHAVLRDRRRRGAGAG